MRISSTVACVLVVVFLLVKTHTFVFAETPPPQVPDTSVETADVSETIPIEIEETPPPLPIPALPSPEEIINSIPTGEDYPTQLIIPSIRLNVPVIDVGLNAAGEMDVPDGSTNNVGWYEDGTVPGEFGSAVLDAHVYAAFKNLRYAKIGDDVYVVMNSGKKLHFRIEASYVYPLQELKPEWLFSGNDKRRLNLITCAGKFIPSMDTYDKRLIVYTVLVDERP